jgi:hypothetical protein
MLVEHPPSLEYSPISVCVLLYSLVVQPRPNYPLLFCREQVGSVGRLLLAGQFGAARSDSSRSVIPVSVWCLRVAQWARV